MMGILFVFYSSFYGYDFGTKMCTFFNEMIDGFININNI